MSKKYKFTDNSKLYFVSFAVTNWIDLFIQDVYRNILLGSIKYRQAKKDLEMYGCCLMTSHVHLITGSSRNAMSNIMRDLKRHTTEELPKAIENNKTESREEWMRGLMKKPANETSKDAKFQLWQAENHPIKLATQKIAWQKLDYTHYNPVEAGFVKHATDWKYSSAIDYAGGKGLLDVILLDPIIV